MKLTAGKSAAFIDRPDKAMRIFLLYGPDSGLVRERGQLLAKHFVADINDAFNVAELTGDALAGDAARLSDEMATIPMLGGARLVRVRDAGDSMFAALEACLENLPPGESYVILEAGDLDKRSKMRNRIEDDSKAITIPCYPEEGYALDKSIQAILKEQNFTIEREALEALQDLLPPDRIGIRMEMDKLMTYAWDSNPKRITLEAVEDSLADSNAQDMDGALWAAASGDFAALERQMMRFTEATAPVQILRGLQRHLLRLMEAKAHMANGMDAEGAMKKLRPPVFFKFENAMRRQLNRWSLPALERALSAMVQIEQKTKQTGMPAEDLAQRALIDVARRAS